MQGKNLPNPTGWVSRLQRFSTKDGPGIRTTAFLKGCSLECPWCSNPELISPSQEIIAHRTLCIRCGKCCAACPTGALSWQEDGVVCNATQKLDTKSGFLR
ncbi:MAG: 4Fe-4S cluster-binding domain-containing protein [Anaerolineales bacterium]|nr:4Fe-4S cluster-binding domain-containing protein [Anaerolineales bacterium]